MTPGTYSVVIPTLNAADEIGGLLRIVMSQEPAPLEVLVVDSSSDDGTRDMVGSFEGVGLRVIERADFDHGGTRHDALMGTTGEFVCFLTQDAVPVGTDYFARLLGPFEDPAVAMVSGRQLPKPDARPFERLVRGYNYPEKSFVRTKADIERLGIKAFFASDVCSAYRRSAYLGVGGFERPLNTNEDMLIASRFLTGGMKVAYAADAWVLHSHNLTPRQQYERNRQVGMFLESHAEDFAGLSEVGEGRRLVAAVSRQLVAERRPIELAAFAVDCAARLLGNRAGRHAARRLRGAQAEEPIASGV